MRERLLTLKAQVVSVESSLNKDESVRKLITLRFLTADTFKSTAEFDVKINPDMIEFKVGEVITLEES